MTETAAGYRALDAADLDIVNRFHQLARGFSGSGCLAARSRSELSDVLADPRSVSVGAFDQAGSLVGYALYATTRTPIEKAYAFLRSWGEAGAEVAESRGIAIHPDWQNVGLGRNLIARQMAILREREILHAFNTIFHENSASLTVRLRSGAVLVDHVIDADGLNYLAYTGPLASRYNLENTAKVPSADIEEQQELFTRGSAVIAIETVAGHEIGAAAFLFSPRR